MRIFHPGGEIVTGKCFLPKNATLGCSTWTQYSKCRIWRKFSIIELWTETCFLCIFGQGIRFRGQIGDPEPPGGEKSGIFVFFHRLQSYAWLRAPVNLCPIGLKISVHVATMCGYGWREFQVPSSRIVGLGSSDVREKSLPGWKFRVEDFSMSVSSQLAPLICARFRSKLLCMYSDSGASADMNLKSLTQLLQDCMGE